jgi:histidinol-phosphate aminotransferase
MLKDLVRPNILALEPYSCARNEFTGEARVYVDANENPYNSDVNRYPDPLQIAVKRKIAALKGVRETQIFLGNGSDEAIDLPFRIFCRPGIDNVVAPAPTYGMYQVCADINDIEYRSVPMKPDFQLDLEGMKARIDDNTKLVFLCSPNNPTGNALRWEDIQWFLDNFRGITIVDEAYIDFSSQPSLLRELDRYPRMMVLQTFSKAWGQAAIRLGMAFAGEEIIRLMNNVKYPYNVNILTQKQALRVLDNIADKDKAVKEILQQRDMLRDRLNTLECVDRIYPSDANFLLVKVYDADNTYKYLLKRGIIVRNRNRVTLCKGCLRITVGTPSENEEIISALKEYKIG